MKQKSFSIFTYRWPQKLIAIVVAMIIWLLINNTLTVTRTLPNIAVRVINIPAEKTVSGLLPDGTLEERISLTVTGTKADVETLRSKDLEVLVNGTGQPDQWSPYISKRNLVDLSLNGDIVRHLSSVSAEEFTIHFTKLITDKIPVIVTPPVGSPPKGYQYLDVWPQQLTITLTGPEEDIKELKKQGLTLTLDLKNVSSGDLDTLQASESDIQRDEVSYFVPPEQKRVAIPFQEDQLMEINDPSAQYLRIDFLRRKRFAVGDEIPITLFYPLKNSAAINPETSTFASSQLLQKDNGITVLSLPLYASDISGHFIEVIKNNLMIVVTAAPATQNGSLPWSVFFSDRELLEDRYVALAIADNSDNRIKGLQPQQREEYLRQRFRSYLYGFRLLTEGGDPLSLDIQWVGSEAVVKLGSWKGPVSNIPRNYNTPTPRPYPM